MASKLSNAFAQYERRFEALSDREQWIIGMGGGIAILVVIIMLIVDPIVQDNKKLEKDLRTANGQTQRIQSQLDNVILQIQDDPNDALRAKIKGLELENVKIDEQLQSQTVNLVPAQTMPKMLEKVLLSSRGLEIIELHSLPPVPVLKTEDKMAQDINLFRHGVALTLKGSFFNIQRYLERLESLEWQFYWKKFDYTVAEYPDALVEIELYTLSTNKAFIGI